jgi:tetratricopeptide (TPR) repeat protein
VELATNRKAMGQKEKALQLFARAVEDSNSRGYAALAVALQDLALGRKAKPPEQKVAEKPVVNQPADPQPKMDQHLKVASAAPNQTPVTDERRKPAFEQASPLSKDQPRIFAGGGGAKSDMTISRPPEKTPHAQPKTPAQDYKKLEMVGKGPFTLGHSSQPQAVPLPQAEGNKNQPQASASVPTRQPERLAIWLKNPDPNEQKVPSDNAHRLASAGLQKEDLKKKRELPENKAAKVIEKKIVDEKSRLAAIRQDLMELRKLKQTGDESGMIAVLERIAENYAFVREFEKGLLGLTASIAFREKIGKKDGMDLALYHRGIMKEKMGDLSGALEDLARSLVLSQSDSKTASTAGASAKAIISRMRVEPTILDSLQRFWRSRAARDDQAETQALYTAAKIYDKAERNQDALNYYDRSSASLLTDKARIYEKIGKGELAEQLYAQALEAFKRLDYSRYLKMKLNSKKPGSLSQN